MFNIKMTGQKELQSVLDPKKYVAAARTAYAEAHANSLLQASTLVSNRYNLTPQFLLSGSTGSKPIIQASQIGSDGLSGSIKVKRGGISLVYFGAMAERATAKKRKLGNVKVQIKRGKTTALKQFIATMPSGHTGIFRRATKRRLPIIESAVSASSMFFNPQVVKPLTTLFVSDIRRNFSQQLQKQGVTP